MPPKGWRKNADGTYPVPSKDTEPVSIDDILFPRSVITRLARSTLAENNTLSKDSLIALQRSATVFVSHLMFHARTISKDQDRKTVNSQDIIAALEKSEFAAFIPTVRKELELFNINKENKKKEKESSKEKGPNDEVDTVDQTMDQSADDSPATKKSKDNSGNEVSRSVIEVDSDDEATKEEADDDNNDDTKEENDDIEEDNSIEEVQEPLSTLEKDEKELRGDENEEDTISKSDEDDFEDAEEGE